MPLSVTVSILVFSLWVFSLVVNHYWPPVGPLVFSLLLLANFAVALCMLKVTGALGGQGLRHAQSRL